MNTLERNKQARMFILDKVNFAEDISNNTYSDMEDYELLSTCLDKLINVNAKGFRGVVTTAITGMHLNPNFNPLTDFYSCNPRSIFEQGIFYAFQEKNIPCGKSDPLNVAKNTYHLNEAWCKGKRPESSAKAAVTYLTLIINSDQARKERLINLFFFKLVQYSRAIEAIEIATPNDNTLSSQETASKLVEFTLRYPESGTIPQFVLASLIKKVYEFSAVSVEGGDESVFGTNTTSKKPADIWLSYNDVPYKLFEITVKKIDKKRLDDCISSLQSVSHIDKPVVFICRIPEDINTLDVHNLSLTYKGKKFDFIDISNFIYASISLISSEQLGAIMTEINAFISHIDRSLSTKHGWNRIFSNT